MRTDSQYFAGLLSGLLIGLVAGFILGGLAMKASLPTATTPSINGTAYTVELYIQEGVNWLPMGEDDEWIAVNVTQAACDGGIVNERNEITHCWPSVSMGPVDLADGQWGSSSSPAWLPTTMTFRVNRN